MLSFSSPGSPKIRTGCLHASRYQVMLQMTCALLRYKGSSGHHSLLAAREASACMGCHSFFLGVGAVGGGGGRAGEG